jgi:hypothetical protein
MLREAGDTEGIIATTPRHVNWNWAAYASPAAVEEESLPRP